MTDSVYPEAAWRLILSLPADGSTNMATDEAIVRAVTAGLSPPTLRLYAWTPPCLSLGRGQAGAEVDRAACVRDGVDVVRRATGGRAILHTDELTYSVVAPPDEPRLVGDIVTSYHRLSRALLAALQHLNLQAESRFSNPASSAQLDADHGSRVTDHESRSPNPVCFEVPSHYELTTRDGRKLVGSAQMRTNEAVLQHGTLPLVGDIARICRYLADAPDADRVRVRAATLESALDRPVEWDDVAAAMVEGFGLALNLTFSQDELAREEQDWVSEIRQTKYAADGWTWRL